MRIKRMTIIGAALGAVISLGGLTAAGATVHAPAPRAAVVNDCAPASHDAGGTCGTWESGAHLFMAVKPGFGTVLVGSPAASTGFNGTQFLITHVAGSPNHDATVEWAPGGNESGLYLTDVNGQARLTSGPVTAFKEWDYTGGCGPVGCTGPFQNEGSLRFLQSNGANANLTTAAANGAGNQDWTFVLTNS